jgi:hypothetical protein
MVASLLALAVAALAPSPAAELTLEQAVGQRIVVSLPGTTVPDALAHRVRRGEVAGVILFGPTSPRAASCRRSPRACRQSAAAGRARCATARCWR